MRSASSTIKVLVSVNARKAILLLAPALAVFLVCLPLFSQGGQGTIQGGVFDQTGGAIAGATVTVTDVARGVARPLITDSAGAYIATNLTPGIYTVRGEAKGFQALEHSNIQVQVDQSVRIDLTLQPGAQTQTVTVTSEVPLIDTTDATLGGTVSNAAILALPLNGRNFQRLLQLRPGVIATIGAGSGSSTTNGRRAGNDVMVVEGIAQFSGSGSTNGVLNMVYRGGDTSSLLPIDAIQEFNNEQNPKAEYGWRDGSIITVGVKSGTNNLHGTAYAFGRDAAATDAGNAFPLPPNTTPSITPATLEQFGATVGGRIIKDKLFWFAGYEGLRDILGDVSVDQIPSDIHLPDTNKNLPPGTGDLSNSMLDVCNFEAANGEGGFNPIGTTGPNGVVNALSAQLAGITINPVAGCKISASTSSFENLFPYNTTASNSFAPGLISTGPLNNGVIKGDYAPGPHNHFNGLYYRSKTSQLVNYAPGQLIPEWEGNVVSDIRMFDGAWTWTPNSTWVNDARLGATYFTAQTFAGDIAKIPVNTYPSGYSMNTGVTNPLYGGLPQISISGFSGYLGAGGRSSSRGPEGDISFVETVSYLRGKHAFKFGFDYVDVLFDGNSFNNAQGSVQFSTLQSFVTGSPKKGSIVVGNAAFNARGHWYGAFAQDDWRVAPRVTLNLGLRWEFIASPTERDNFMANFDPNVNPLTTPAVQRVGPGEPLPYLYKASYLGFSPRVGAAWDVTGNGKTVVRAAFSILRDTTPLGPFFPTIPFGANFPSISGYTPSAVANAHTPVTFNLTPGLINWNTTGGAIFPAAAPTTIGGVIYDGVTCTPLSSTINGVVFKGTPCPMSSIDPSFHEPYAGEWNLDVQRAITNNLTLDVAYVGNHGFQEPYNHDLNEPALGVGWNTPWTAAQLTAAKQSTNDAGLTSAQMCLGQGSAPFCSANTGAEVGLYSSLFPYFSSISQFSNGDFSNYNGLQVTVVQRASHGLSFIAGYTFSHALDMVSQTGGGIPLSVFPYDLRQDYATSSNDIRNRFTFSPTYNIPGMKFPGQMLEGWSLSSIITLQGGMPWYPGDKTNDFQGNGEVNNSVVENWNYSGPVSAFTAGPNSIPCYDGVSGSLPGCVSYAATPSVIQQECANAATAPYGAGTTNAQLALAALANFGCYVQAGGILTPPAYGSIGNASRNIFRGPGYYNVDLSVAKIWHVKERYSAEFRAEFFNLFNRADFPTPAVTDPTSGVTGQFGCSCSTPDTSNPVLGSGGPRHIQFGLKLTF
jgi:hypothetical protein